MGFNLPSDILYIVFDCLRDERDYNSIYQSAISSKIFAAQALTVLYQLHHTSPVTGGGTEDEQFRTRGLLLANVRSLEYSVFRKWALMWRSIILSTMDKTYLPYYSYIRYLDLNDLGNLLTDSRFTGKARDEFLPPELDDWLSPNYEAKGMWLWFAPLVPCMVSRFHILKLIAEAIVERTKSIRGLSCSVPASSLSEWIEMLPLLQTLTIWSGDALTQHAGDKIRKHCPGFKQLRVYTWKNEPPRNAEADSEQFLNELHPHTLEYFEIISYSQLGPRSIRTIGTQLNSLVELKLTSLSINAIAELPSLTSPPTLKVLVLTDSIPTPPDEEYYSIVKNVAQWITSCNSLRRLELRRFTVDDAMLLSQALTDQGPHLTTLSATGYSMASGRAFHDALASQQTLQNLYLRGEGGDNPNDNSALVQGIGQLTDLRELELRGISDGFFPDHVMTLTPFLPRLERLWISGDYFDDAIWTAFSCLPQLKSLAIYALSEFTTEGILDFISRLGPGNKGFNLSILNATMEGRLSDEEQTVVRDMLRYNLNGSLDFALAYEESSDSDSENLSD